MPLIELVIHIFLTFLTEKPWKFNNLWDFAAFNTRYIHFSTFYSVENFFTQKTYEIRLTNKKSCAIIGKAQKSAECRVVCGFAEIASTVIEQLSCGSQSEACLIPAVYSYLTTYIHIFVRTFFGKGAGKLFFSKIESECKIYEYPIEYARRNNQAFHENLDAAAAGERLYEHMQNMKQMQFETKAYVFSVLISKKGKVTIKKKAQKCRIKTINS